MVMGEGRREAEGSRGRGKRERERGVEVVKVLTGKEDERWIHTVKKKADAVTGDEIKTHRRGERRGKGGIEMGGCGIVEAY